MSLDLDDIEPLRAHICSLPEGERDRAAAAVGAAIAAKLAHDATTGDGILRRMMPPEPVDDDYDGPMLEFDA